MTETDEVQQAELLVCIKCRRGVEAPEDDRRPGARLYDNLTTRELPEGVTVTPVECLQNCDDGCTVALRGPGRWTYIYGRLHEDADVETLVGGAELYRGTTDGLIPWRQRPEHFKRNCIARVPPLTPAKEAANG
ncbi:DUF1636 family protein [Amaricoccus macauensis]|uniref:DUF1636 family protein n=1 Tax=Amaricoccus macauensis TaxID=57001 RepID=UPI003C7BD3D3